MAALLSQRVEVDGFCPICLQHPETLQHLVSECVQVIPLWNELSSNLGSGSSEGFAAWFESRIMHGDLVQKLCCVAICWCVWRARNDIVFNNTPWHIPRVTFEVARLVNEWMDVDSLPAGGGATLRSMGSGVVLINSSQLMPYQHVVIDSTQDSPTIDVSSVVSIQSSITLDVSSMVPIQSLVSSPVPITFVALQHANDNFQVYTMKKKRLELEHGSQPTCGQGIDSISSPQKENMEEVMRKAAMTLLSMADLCKLNIGRTLRMRKRTRQTNILSEDPCDSSPILSPSNSIFNDSVAPLSKSPTPIPSSSLPAAPVRFTKVTNWETMQKFQYELHLEHENLLEQRDASHYELIQDLSIQIAFLREELAQRGPSSGL
nr:Retrovirus-related Pol polyprotein from transposon TNT 1-94 [Ipomoea batatas]